jgi:hypothetical protein
MHAFMLWAGAWECFACEECMHAGTVKSRPPRGVPGNISAAAAAAAASMANLMLLEHQDAERILQLHTHAYTP